MSMKVTKDTSLAEIMEVPEFQEILTRHNLPCLSCPFAKSEMEDLKIGEICEMYKINFEKLLKDLNKVCDK